MFYGISIGYKDRHLENADQKNVPLLTVVPVLAMFFAAFRGSTPLVVQFVVGP